VACGPTPRAVQQLHSDFSDEGVKLSLALLAQQLGATRAGEVSHLACGSFLLQDAAHSMLRALECSGNGSIGQPLNFLRKMISQRVHAESATMKNKRKSLSLHVVAVSNSERFRLDQSKMCFVKCDQTLAVVVPRPTSMTSPCTMHGMAVSCQRMLSMSLAAMT